MIFYLHFRSCASIFIVGSQTMNELHGHVRAWFSGKYIKVKPLQVYLPATEA